MVKRRKYEKKKIKQYSIGSGRKDGRHENGVGFVVSEDTLPQVK